MGSVRLQISSWQVLRLMTNKTSVNLFRSNQLSHAVHIKIFTTHKSLIQTENIGCKTNSRLKTHTHPSTLFQATEYHKKTNCVHTTYFKAQNFISLISQFHIQYNKVKKPSSRLQSHMHSCQGYLNRPKCTCVNTYPIKKTSRNNHFYFISNISASLIAST